MVKMYKKDLIANVDKGQIAAMKQAGWGEEAPAVKKAKVETPVSKATEAVVEDKVEEVVKVVEEKVETPKKEVPEKKASSRKTAARTSRKKL